MDKIKPEKNNEMKIGNLPEKGFRIMILKMIQDLGGRGLGNGEDARNI